MNAVAGAAGFVARCTLALGMRVAIPFSWPFLKLASIGAFPSICQGAPGPARALALFFGYPMTIILLTESVLRWKQPLAVRRIQLWRRMLPVYVAYVLKEREIRNLRTTKGISQDDVDELWDLHHEWGGDKVYEMVLEANGYIVKVAQIIASKPDVVPHQWISRLSKLFDDMPHRPWREIQIVMDREIEELMLEPMQLNGTYLLFETVDQVPIAAASIAQVHVATLSKAAVHFLGSEWGDKSKVVVKIQRDIVKGLMAADLNNAEMMGEFLKNVLPFEVKPIVEEMRRAIPLEFDFVREARLSQVVRSRLNIPEFAKLHIPKAAMGFCSSRMMVSEFMEGTPFSKLLSQSKTNPELRRKMQDSMVMIIKAYGRMMLFDGMFHGDPHPGNILLAPNGDVVLLDFGQCKVLTFNRQMALARLILAMHDGDALSIITALSCLGVNFRALRKDAKVDPADVVKMAFMIYDTKFMPEALVNPFGGAEEHLLSIINIEDFPPDLWLVSRVMMILRGICHDLDVDIHANKLWKQYALAAVKDEKGARERSIENQLLDVGTLSEIQTDTFEPAMDLSSLLDDLWTKGV